jgi:hypothetical protein
MLLEKGADPKARDSQGCTVLHLAWPDPDFIRCLLAAGADPNAKNNEGLTPLEFIQKEKWRKGYLDAMIKAYQICGLAVPDKVITGSEKTVRTAEEFQDFIHAFDTLTRAQMTKICETIRANPAVLKEWKGLPEFVLHYGDKITNVLACMITNGVNVNVGSSLALRYAVQDNNAIECARMLIAAGADVNTLGHEGRTLLHETAISGLVPAAELLLRAGVKINARNAKGQTPLGMRREWAKGGWPAPPEYEAFLLKSGATE